MRFTSLLKSIVASLRYLGSFSQPRLAQIRHVFQRKHCGPDQGPSPEEETAYVELVTPHFGQAVHCAFDPALWCLGLTSSEPASGQAPTGDTDARSAAAGPAAGRFAGGHEGQKPKVEQRLTRVADPYVGRAFGVHHNLSDRVGRQHRVRPIVRPNRVRLSIFR